MSGVVREQNLDKQMGCMAGFLQIFDRTQFLTGKRLYSTKRLPPSSVLDASSDPEKSLDSPAISTELEKPHYARSMPSPEHFKQQQSPANDLLSPLPELQPQPKSPLPLPVFEIRQGNKSSWKFCKESPRLSLDSRATFDARGSLKPKEIPTNASILSISRRDKNGEEIDDSDKQRRSPSVIARLMGLEKLPEWETEQVSLKTPELRRSASESRASRDLLQYRFIDGINFQLKQSQQQTGSSSNVIIDGLLRDQAANCRAVDSKKCNAVRNPRTEPARAPHRGIGQRKSFFDSTDFFPEPKQTVSMFGEIEKRLRMRGIDEPSKDLEALKQILEALQLKGLLHSNKPLNQTNQRNFVYDGSFSHDESPIVLMKPVRSTALMNRQGRCGYDSASNFKARPAVRRESILTGDTLPAMSPRRDRPDNRGRNLSSPTRSESSVKSPNRKRPLSVETQRRTSNNSIEQRRVSPIQSPKVNSRRNIPDQMSNRSPRNRKPTDGIYQREEKVFVPAVDESSSISESSLSTSSQTDNERSKLSDYKKGRHLLERCDKLLNSIAEITAIELQPSPVSVLDSSFYKEESAPSPVMKRSFDFKDPLAELEDDIWSPAISPLQLKSEENSNLNDCDYIYISDIIRATNYLPQDSDVFLLLEKQQYLKGMDTSKASTLERRLVFDTITEILNRRRQLPLWKAIQGSKSSLLQQVWSEFQRIRERNASDNLLEAICGLLRKDLDGDAMDGWGDSPIEMSESVLDIERLIFKDLIGETIRDLAAFPGKCSHQSFLPRRKLVF